ncbi:MAG: hypothetical protein IJB96_02700, partial [Lachnospira sp.]|nr:hypothetical protein [Lachnospira sp.]
MKIAIMTLYFGKLPSYIDLWLDSCRCNPDVDFIIYTDDEGEYLLPSNVYIKRCTFEDMRTRIASHFDFPISLKSPYKLCDFKATYGDVFSDEFAGYDFWGHCDLDQV